MKDLLNIATAYNDKIRIYACNTTNIVKHAKEIFNLWPTSCAGLGRTLTIACIMSEMEKMDSKITIKIEGDGPIKNIVVVAKKGEVKGFCYNPGVYLSNNNGKLLVGEAIGNGYLTVIKDYGLKEPFTSTVSLQTGEIGEDFAYYFNQSEQTNTAVALGVLFDKEGNVTDAGGYVIQVMPNCPIDIIEKLEEILKNIKPISTLLNEGKNIKDIISILSSNDSFDISINMSKGILYNFWIYVLIASAVLLIIICLLIVILRKTNKDENFYIVNQEQIKSYSNYSTDENNQLKEFSNEETQKENETFFNEEESQNNKKTKKNKKNKNKSSKGEIYEFSYDEDYDSKH